MTGCKYLINVFCCGCYHKGLATADVLRKDLKCVSYEMDAGAKLTVALSSIMENVQVIKGLQLFGYFNNYYFIAI